MLATPVRLRRGRPPQKGKQPLTLRREMQRPFFKRRRGFVVDGEETSDDAKKIGLRWEKDDVVGGCAGEIGLRGGKLRSGVLNAVVGRGDEHLGWDVAGRYGQEVEIHLRGEALGVVDGGCDPPCEWDETVYVLFVSVPFFIFVNTYMCVCTCVKYTSCITMKSRR